MESALLFTRVDGTASYGDDASNAEQALRERSGSYAPNIYHSMQAEMTFAAGILTLASTHIRSMDMES